MKRLLILISLIIISSNVYCQNLKGSYKYGGEYQNGEPFKVTYRIAMFGKLEGGSLVTDMPVNVEFTIFFNYNNENNIKVIFPDGKHNFIYNINNIEKTSYRQEAEGGQQNRPPYNNMTVFLEPDTEFTIINNTTRDVIRLTMPK